MFINKFSITLVLLTLLLLKCNSSSSNKLVGIWEQDCHYLDDSTKFTLKTTYFPDGTFSTLTTSKLIFTFNNSVSGTYKINGTQIKETINYISNNHSNIPLPQSQVVSLDWINSNSFMTIVNKNEFKCLASRASK